MASYYQHIIRDILAERRQLDFDPRHVEAWIRAEHGALDGMSLPRFRREVALGVACIREAGVAESEALAVSFGI